MANLGKIDYSEIDKYINSPLPKLGEVNLSPKMDNVTPSETSRPKLAALDYSKYEDKPFYNDAGAVAKSIGKGAMVNLPEMAGQAAQALSTEGSAVSNWGKGVVDSAKARAKDWQVDMNGRGTVAKSLIEGGEMIAPSLATLPAYLAGPVAGAAATVALYGGSSYQDVYERSKAAGLSDLDAHKAGLMEGAIEAGGELISNKLSLGLLGAGKKAGMQAVTSGTLDKSVLKPFGKAFAKEAVGEQVTEGLQNYAQSKVEGAYGLSKEKGLGESFSETFGPTLGMSALLSPFGLAGHYISAKGNKESNDRAEAIQHVLDSPDSGNKMDRRRVVEMLHSDALKVGVAPKEAAAWKSQAIINIANNQPIYRGEVESEKELPDTSDKANKDLLPTGERLVNKDLFKTYSKFDNLYKLADDPNSEDYQSGYQAITSSLSAIINPEEGYSVDPIKQDEARKVLKLIEDANAVKTRQFNRQLEADKATEQIDQEEAQQEADSSKEESQIDQEELKRLMDEDTNFNEGPIDEVSTEPKSPAEQPIEQADTAKLPSDTTATPQSIDTTSNVVEPSNANSVPTESASYSQAQAAQAEPVEQVVQPVGQEEVKSPVGQEEVKSPVGQEEVKAEPVVTKGKETKPKAPKETKPVEIIPQDSEITIRRDQVASKGLYSIPPKFTGENGELKGKVVGPKLSKTGKVLGYYITTDYKNFDGSTETSTHLISVSSIKGLNETPKERITNTASLNEEVSSDKVAVELGSEDTEVIQNSQEPIKSLEPVDIDVIDTTLAELEDLRDQLEIAEVEDRKEIRSKIKELEATLKEIGYTERQSKVKFTSPDTSTVRVEDDEWTLEVDEDVSGFVSDEDGEERFDIDFQDESLTTLLEDKRKGTLKVLESIGFSQKAKNKYSYVKAKMKEVNSSQEEQNVINKALEQLGQDGKWSWSDLVDLVILQLSDVSLNFVENKQGFSDFGLDRLGLSELDIEKNWKFELRVTGSSGEDLKFSDVPNLKGHDLTDKAIAHIRTFKNREGIWHIAEVQSDVKQEPSFNKDIREKQLVVAKKLKDLSTDDINKISLELLNIKDNLTDDIRSLASEERLDGPGKDIAGRLIDRISLFVDNVEAVDKAGIISASSLQDLVSEVKSYSIAVASKLRGDAPDFFDELYNIESVRKFAVSIINKARLDYNPASYEGVIETAKSFEDMEYQRLKPYIEKRAIREYIKKIVDINPDRSHTFRIATPETLIKIESWNLEAHKDLIRKYTDLSKAVAKELRFKEAVDKAGNTWYEGVVADNYVPLAYDLSWITDNTKTLAQIKKNQAINKRSFDKFLNNISPAIKKEVVFKFIPDFRDANLSDEGLSDKAVTAKGVYKVINGVPHIFMNGASSPEDFAGTFIHEVVGHFGVRKLFERFNSDGTSNLSNYDKFLTTLINNNSFFREQIVNRFSNWSNYESGFIKRNQRKGESTEEMYTRLQSEHKAKGNQGDVVLKFTVDIPKGKETRYIPVEVAVQLADEHIAELAKEMYFNEKFIEKEVGLGLQGDPIRAAKRTQLRAFLNSVWGKVKHYLRSIFGEYINTISQKDLDTMVAASFFNIFHKVDREMLSLGSNKPLSLKRDKPVAINTSGYKVQLEQSDESTRYDQDAGLEENEITNPFLLADIPELSKFIDLTVSGFGNHNDTIRSDTWKKLQEKINDNPLLASMKALGNMPFQEAYTAIQNVYKGQIAKVESTVKDMATVLEGLNASTNDAVFEYMTNPEQNVDLLNITDKQKEKVKQAKDAINELGRVSMELGLIPEESYNRNKDAYLHTMYLKYLDQYRGSGKSTSLLSWMKAKKKLNARERAALGEIKDVKFLIAETLGVISRDHVLINMFNTVAKSSNRNGLYWTLTNEDKIKLPWDNRKIATIDKAYKLVDDMAFIISESKGENKVTFDGKESTIANLVKDREEIISRINALENKALEEAHKHALDSGFTTHEDQHEFLRNHYVRMPNTARYGLLRNQWVRKEIHNDLDVLTASYDLSNKDNIEKFFARGGTLEKVNRLWKMSMVALNPGSWIRNIAGNFTLLDLSTSTSSTKLIGMLHSEIMKTMGDKKPSEFWKLAEEYGLFGTTFSAVELQDMYSKYGDELESARASYESRTASSWEKSIPLFDNRFIAIGKMLAKGKDLGHRTSATTSKAYAFVEGAFKTVSFKDYVLTWESQNQQEFPGGWKSLDETQQRALFAKAAAHANEALFDYSQIPSAIKTLRRIPFGAPFLTFSYKAGPASVRAMINHPVKFAKYATLPALLTMIAMATNDWDDKDIAHFKARLPEYYRNNPGIAFLPFKDSLGRPQILPLDYLLPWSQWATASRKVYANFVKDGGESPIGTSVQSVGTILNEFGFLGGPTPTALAAMLSGKDSFTGRSILTAGASADQQLMEAMMFTYNMATPAWLSSHGWFGKMYQAFGKPDTNQFGEVRFTPAQAVSDITGFRPISVMEKGGIESRRKEFEFRLKEISTYRSQVIRDRSENSISKASKLKDIAIREKMVRTQMREALNP